MGDMINRFLAGKKKYSVFIATFLTSVIAMFADPQTAEGLQEFVPTIAMLISGVAYLIAEGWNDVRRSQSEEAYYNMMGQKYRAEATAAAAPASAATATAPPEPFNESEFISRIHAGAVELARSAFPDAPDSLTSIYRAAEAFGRNYVCRDIREAIAYWEYLAGLAKDAWEELEYNTKDEKGCKLHPPELYEFRATLRRVETDLKNLEGLAASGKPWQGGYATGTTLYNVGAFAGERIAT